MTERLERLVAVMYTEAANWPNQGPDWPLPTFCVSFPLPARPRSAPIRTGGQTPPMHEYLINGLFNELGP